MYRHSSLTPGRTLYYRMRAINSVNENVAVDAANAEWSGEVFCHSRRDGAERTGLGGCTRRR